MTKLISLLYLLPMAEGWLEQRMFLSGYHHRLLIRLSVDKLETETDNPCWQDMYDDDCSMDKTYAASFVASEWLKKMPCAKGIEDCDMPDDLKIPGNREEGHPENVDVMDFLNLKRAPSVDKKAEKGGPMP